MGKKILFAVMALLVMATGKIWAEGETTEQTPTPYALLCPNEGGTTYSMHFVYTTATVNTGDVGESETVEIKNEDGTTEKTLKYTKAWIVLPGGISDMVDKWTNNNGITQVVFEDSFKDFKVTNCSNWFYGLNNLTDITGIENLNTSKVTNIAWMFNGCEKLESPDLTSLDTSNVIYMNSMFQGCDKLESLDLSSFNTSRAANTASMFQGCNSLEKITFGNVKKC